MPTFIGRQRSCLSMVLDYKLNALLMCLNHQFKAIDYLVRYSLATQVLAIDRHEHANKCIADIKTRDVVVGSGSNCDRIELILFN